MMNFEESIVFHESIVLLLWPTFGCFLTNPSKDLARYKETRNRLMGLRHVCGKGMGNAFLEILKIPQLPKNKTQKS